MNQDTQNAMKLVIVNVDQIQAFVIINNRNGDKCRCESKELIDEGICDKRFIQNPNNCQQECDKSCGTGEYLDNEKCNCRKKLVEKCTGDVEEVNQLK